jgi:hypothetical protein
MGFQCGKCQESGGKGLNIATRAGGNSLTIKSVLDPTPTKLEWDPSANGIERFVFANGTTLGDAQQLPLHPDGLGLMV